VRRFVLTRLGTSLLAVLGAALISFLFLRVTAGNPARLVLGPFATPEAIDRLVAQMGLNRSLPEQFWLFVSSFVQGDWGYAYSLGEPVRTAIGQRLGASVELALFAFLFAFATALLLALVSTYRRRPVVDSAVQGIASFGLGVAQFWLGLVLLLVLSEKLHLFPGPEGRLGDGTAVPPSITGLYTVDALLSGHPGTFLDALWHLALPAITLGLAPMAFLTRLLRANLLELSGEPFLLVIESKGISRWRAFTRHALPNALVPTLTAAGLIFGQLLAGGVLVEQAFRWPGVGALVTDGVLRQDYSVVQAFVVLSAIAYVAVNLVVDLLVGAIDPRTRREATR
jgi:ABC-type dipeptide/oligopeptide/nickel transport system permease component